MRIHVENGLFFEKKAELEGSGFRIVSHGILDRDSQRCFIEYEEEGMKKEYVRMDTGSGIKATRYRCIGCGSVFCLVIDGTGHPDFMEAVKPEVCGLCGSRKLEKVKE